MKLDILDKAILQVLIARGFIEDKELKDIFENFKENLTITNNTLKQTIQAKSLNEVFINVNKKVRHLSFEIKSVVIIKNSNNSSTRIVKTYHGFINSLEDEVAKAHGSDLDPLEVKYFSTMIERLLQDDYLSTHDISILPTKPIKWSDLQVQEFIKKLEQLGYLGRTDSNYIQLHARAYLELNSYLSSLIQSSTEDDDDENEEEVSNNKRKRRIQELPQTLTY